MSGTALVITSIAAPNDVLRSFASGCRAVGAEFILIGDVPSPVDFSLDGCRFYGLNEQLDLPFELAQMLPLRHYSRKNLGYLLARNMAVIVESDDDNIPLEMFWLERSLRRNGRSVVGNGWTNAYRYFSDQTVWPRGFPLTNVHDAVPDATTLPMARLHSPIQQGLADEQPDVDAVFRLAHSDAPIYFRDEPSVLLGKGSWCPFNSQNTTWFAEAFPLLYLPSTCTFRMTDIWRSFIAQRIAWTCGWPIAFHSATVRQERNPHDLMKDFAEEIPGYLHNEKICRLLEDLSLQSGVANIGANMLTSYEALVREKYLDASELPLLTAWLSDLAS
jgi:STELLO glycosyltransferases